MKPVTILIVGAGSRGEMYARYALENPRAAKVVAVAEPRDFYRGRVARDHGIEAAHVFSDWREAADRPRLADAVVVATSDRDHELPAVALLEKGYHVLLEKPMAPTVDACRAIHAAAVGCDGVFAVCHVLRYNNFTRKVRSLVDSGAIGEVTGVQRLEPVGNWRYTHAYVRGIFRKEADSSFVLLAKSCHDMDWIRYIVGSPCSRVHSFGGLSHFRKDRKPPEAADAVRCLDCGFEDECPYSAPRFYLGRLREGRTGWPLDVLTPDLTENGVAEALREGPYGRCVYECDNDVADQQVVNLEFDSGATASFMLTAFSGVRGRQTHVFGTRGELIGDDQFLDYVDLVTGRTQRIDTGGGDATELGGHGGGDRRVMDAFVSAVATGDRSRVLSGPQETLESHLIVFAAERSRREGRVVDLSEM